MLIEHYAGAFPVWIAPLHVSVIPVSDRHLDYAVKVEAALKKEGIRAKVDSRSERMNVKIRDAQMDKVPYMMILGDREVENSTVSIRLRTGEQLSGQPLEKFASDVKIIITSRSNQLLP